MTRSEEGFAEPSTDEEGADAGDVLFRVDGVEVRESTWAGAYYCAHVLYVATRLAHTAASTVADDHNGDPLVGFLHVPNDDESTGATPSSGPRTRVERHARTTQVVACALRGIIEEVGAAPVRVLVTGFGPFAAVVSNPTGDFVEHAESVSRALELATGHAPREIETISDGPVRIGVQSAGNLVLGRLTLDVDDTALDAAHKGSLPWAAQRFAPHAVVSLGVHRGSSIYRVELEATSAGLAMSDGAPRHERGRPIDAREPKNRALSRVLVRGAKALGLEL